ncbi:MAG: aminotransferase class I/II-fold pyridoxal phosphate-dependent enzyme [Angustibacter sp.]
MIAGNPDPTPAPLAAQDQDGHVVYVRSLTKSIAPGLRVGCVAARGAAGSRLRAARVVDDLYVSGPLQEAALDVVSSPGWRRHLSQLAPRLAQRRDALMAAVAREVPAVTPVGRPGGGLHLWVRLPAGMSDLELTAVAAAEGVVVHPGSPLFPAEPPGPFLRLTFGAASIEDLVEGARRLGRAVART